MLFRSTCGVCRRSPGWAPRHCAMLPTMPSSLPTVVSIGNGTKVIYGNSNWIAGCPLRAAFPLLHVSSRRKGRSVAQALAGHRWVADIRRQNPSQPFLLEFLAAWRLLLGAAERIQPDVDDSITWTANASGDYSAKSAYHLQFEGRQHSHMELTVWRAWAPPKQKFFAWLLLQNRLWCADRLQRRGWPTSTSASSAGET